MKKLIYLLFFLSYQFNSYTQNWIKYIGSAEEDMSLQGSAIQTSDGGFLMIGTVIKVLARNSYDVQRKYLIKTDGEGNILWATRTLGVGSWPQLIESLKPDFTESSYYIGTLTNDSNSESDRIHIMRANKDGEFINSSILKDEKSMHLGKLYPSKEGPIIQANLIDNKDVVTDYLFIRTNQKGFETDFTLIEAPKQIIKKGSIISTLPAYPDQTYFLWSENKTEKHFLSEVKNGKNTVWTAAPFDSQKFFNINQVIEFKEAKYLFGKGDQKIQVVKLDKDGARSWAHEIGNIFGPYRQVISENGDIFILCGRPTSNPKDRARVVKISQEGELLWQKSYLLGDQDKLGSIILKKNGQLALIGTARHPINSKSYIIIINIDKDGNTVELNGDYPIISSELFNLN